MINHRPPDGWLCTVSEGVEGSHSRSWCRKPGKSSKILALPQILSKFNWAKRVTCCNGQISLRWSGSLHECSLYFRDWHWRWTFAKMSHLTPQWFGQAVVGQAGDVQVFEKQELQWVLWTSSSIMILMIQVIGTIQNCWTNSDLLRNFNLYDYHDSILPNWFKISQKLSFPSLYLSARQIQLTACLPALLTAQCSPLLCDSHPGSWQSWIAAKNPLTGMSTSENVVGPNKL